MTAFYQCDISDIAMNDCVKPLLQNNLYLSFISSIDSVKAFEMTLSFSCCQLLYFCKNKLLVAY